MRLLEEVEELEEEKDSLVPGCLIGMRALSGSPSLSTRGLHGVENRAEHMCHKPCAQTNKCSAKIQYASGSLGWRL